MAAFMWVLKEQAYGFLSALLHFLPGASSVVLCTCNCSLCKTYYTAVTESIFGVFKKISNLLLTKTLHSIIIALSVSLTDDYIIAENSRFDVFVKLIFFVSSKLYFNYPFGSGNTSSIKHTWNFDSFISNS